VSDKQTDLQVRLSGRAFHLLMDGPIRLPRTWLDEAKATGTKKVFISFHAPVYCRAGMGPIPEAQNPHKTLASYAKDLDIVVFNGHVHTTEVF